jgi:hypothetical protein
MGSTENSYPDTYIERELALDVAYASKEQRCLAAASRLVDAALEPLKEFEDLRIAPIAPQLSVVAAMMEIHKVYPEAFAVGPSYLRKIEGELMMLTSIPTIVEAGGLPLKSSEWGSSYQNISAEELDQIAELREGTALTLLANPPSDDFLQDHDLREFGWIELDVKIDKVLGLLSSANHHYEEIVKEYESFLSDVRKYEAGNYSRETKLEDIVAKLNHLRLMWGEAWADMEYGAEFRSVMRSDTTTLRDLEALWRKGISVVVDLERERAHKKQRAFDMIMSGEAHTYVSEESN